MLLGGDKNNGEPPVPPLSNGVDVLYATPANKLTKGLLPTDAVLCDPAEFSCPGVVKEERQGSISENWDARVHEKGKRSYGNT